MEKEIKLIVCDVDGTILPSGKYEISERLREDFHKAMKKGIKVLINTGRHYTFLPQSFFKDLPMDRIGTINGACLVDRNGNPIEKHPMSEKEMNDFIEISDKYGIGLGFKFEDSVVTYANHEIFMAGYVSKDDPRRRLIIDDTQKRTHHLEHCYPLGTFLICDEDVITPVKKDFPNIVFAWSCKRGYDAFLKSVTKADSIIPVLKENNITWDNVIAFGDAANDLEMVKFAGHGVAMGNACPELKECADEIALTNNEDGIAHTLNQLIFS